MNTDKIYAESIANEYSIKNDSKVVALKKLDRKVKEFPLLTAIVLGVISTLILGTGMSLAMGAIGGTEEAFAAGIILGVVGMIGMAVNYPIYKRMIAGRKSRYAGDIIRLANEIARKA
ncbi:MAG: dihydropteridine reductase [Eubacteriales bacterium]|nr:dihydropteridine reductase [Eubacteriales bacterium]